MTNEELASAISDEFAVMASPTRMLRLLVRAVVRLLRKVDQ